MRARMMGWFKCMALGSALPSLFVSQGLLKVALFLAPGTIAFFQSVGYSLWLASLVIGSELYLLVKTAFAMNTCGQARRTLGACNPAG